MTLLLSLTIAHALTKEQLQTVERIKFVAKHIKDDKGEAYTQTLLAIALTESSLGVQVVGDLDKNDIKKSSLGVFQFQLATAKHIIKKDDYLTPRFKHLLHNDKVLMSMLLTNVEFSTLLAGRYFLYNLRLAKERHMWNPWYRAISRHNGGWNNKTYYDSVVKNLNLLKKEGVI